MANTLIQIKRSTSTNQPSGGSLSVGEPAYSYLSNVAFIGTSDGTGVLPIGGQFYVNRTNSALDIAVAAFNAANSAGGSEAAAAFDKANTANLIASLAFDKANSANVLAYNTGIGANAFAAATIAGANAAVGAGANAYADLVGAGANNYLLTVIAGANTVVGTGANAYADSATAGANNYLLAVIAGANTAVGAGANNYADSTFVKLTAASQTITGELSVVGNLTISGNTSYINAVDLQVFDPLIYLAANNTTSDIIDIGFLGTYNNGSSNLYTGLYREHVDKEYYLFQGYDTEPLNNHLGAFSNNMVLAVLNADIKTSNLWLGGANAILTISSVGTAANAFAAATIAGANAAVGAGANAFASATIAGANTAVGTGANTYLLSVIAGANSAVGAGANAYTSAFASNAANITSGTLVVARGGTGVNTFANNGVLFGNTTSGLRVTSAGTEGQVLQASDQGTPFFGHLDGGTF